MATPRLPVYAAARPQLKTTPNVNRKAQGRRAQAASPRAQP